MIEYNYIEKDFSNISEEELREIIRKCSFLVLDYDKMISKRNIKTCTTMHRGAAVYFKDGLFSWAYNIKGYYIKIKNII
jgi:hypothetical protein